jgi:hypothetical protein
MCLRLTKKTLTWDSLLTQRLQYQLHGIVRLISPIGLVEDYGGEKLNSSYMPIVILIPHFSMPHPTPPQPHVMGRGGGARGVVGVAWDIAWVGYDKNIVYILIYTHILIPRLRWDKMKILRSHFIFNHFQLFQPSIECHFIPIFLEITVIQ